jgi:hypothetical protein
MVQVVEHESLCSVTSTAKQRVMQKDIRKQGCPCGNKDQNLKSSHMLLKENVR